VPDFHILSRATGISRPWLAAAIGRTRTAIDRWCDGTARPPAAVVEWLERRAADPPPILAPVRETFSPDPTPNPEDK
jgi:hypothetical protein